MDPKVRQRCTNKVTADSTEMPQGFQSKVMEDSEQRITFSLRNVWKLPEFYERGSIEDIEKALELGADCLGAIRDIATEVSNTAGKVATDERISKKIAEIERRANHEVDMARKERSTLSAEVESLRAKCAGMAAAADERAETIRAAAAIHSERKIIELSATIESLQGILLGEDERRSGEVRRAVEAKESMIAYLKEEKGRAEGVVRELQEALLTRGKVRASAVLKGKEGEEDFEEAAAGMGWGLMRTSKESHQCDYKGNIRGMNVFFEIKAHDEIVPSKELGKFHRDMKEHPEVGAGVFIALYAPLKAVGGTRAGFWTEWTDDGRLMIFVGEFLRGVMPVEGTLKVVGQILEIAARIWSAKVEGDAGIAAALEGRLRMGVKYLEGAAERLRVLYNKIVIDRKAATDAYDTTLGMLKMAREEIGLTLGTLLGTHKFGEEEDDEAVEEDVKEPPKKRVRKKKDEIVV